MHILETEDEGPLLRRDHEQFEETVEQPLSRRLRVRVRTECGCEAGSHFGCRARTRGQYGELRHAVSEYRFEFPSVGVVDATEEVADGVQKRHVRAETVLVETDTFDEAPFSFLHTS